MKYIINIINNTVYNINILLSNINDKYIIIILNNTKNKYSFIYLYYIKIMLLFNNNNNYERLEKFI